jgi:hypothetical protein
MVGANPKQHEHVGVHRVTLPHLAADRRWRWALVACVFVPLSLLLVQCGRAPNPGALAANAAPASPGDSFDDRFPKPQFRDRFPTANEALPQHQLADFAPKPVQTETYKVASIEPTLPYQRPSQPTTEEITTLVSMKSSAFPYFGNNPASDSPFLNISSGDRRGHRS